ARDALKKGLAVPELKEEMDLYQQMTLDLGLVHEAAEEFLPAANAYIEAAKMLEHPDIFVDHGNLTRDLIAQRAAEIFERAGRMFVRARRFDDALAAYKLAQERYPASAARLSLCLAEIAQEQNNLPEALRHLDAYLRVQPQGHEPYEMKIALLQK